MEDTGGDAQDIGDNAEPPGSDQSPSPTAPAAGVDVAALTQLFQEVDFVGVSAYAPLKPDFQPQVGAVRACIRAVGVQRSERLNYLSILLLLINCNAWTQDLDVSATTFFQVCPNDMRTCLHTASR